MTPPLLLFLTAGAFAFHDCVQPKSALRLPPSRRAAAAAAPAGCNGGLCVGMRGGPHEGGPSHYVVGNASTGFTSVRSTMTVPLYPKEMDGITYFFWSDLFFGDMSQGRMNQIVPQLLLGEVLSGSTGPPDYNPIYSTFSTWMFGAHYFFEVLNASTLQIDAKAAYGGLYPALEGETIFTTFDVYAGPFGPAWLVRMGVEGDATRVSEIRVEQPYMGLGRDWAVPSTSWAELNYTDVCINSCWEIYGGVDADHLPSSGAEYEIVITRGEKQTYPWVAQWDQDEGAGSCFHSNISESHTQTVQTVNWGIIL